MSSSFFTKSTLRNLYLEQKRSTYDIAKQFSCNPKTVYYWLGKHGIQTRPRKVVVMSKTDLAEFYKKGFSLKTIGDRAGITASAVYKKMKFFHLSRRSPWEANIKHKRKNFSNDKIEKAYLIGFRIGDLQVIQNSSSVIVKSNTTHLVQMELIKRLFSQYGPCWVSSSKMRTDVFHCTINLNKTFAFLVPKPTTLPMWIKKSNRFFLAFLAGYIDAEGTIRIYAKRARLRIGSYDKTILHQIHERLILWNIKSSFRLESKADYIHRNGDFYRVDIMDKYALSKCLSILIPYLKHKRRHQDACDALANAKGRM